jgi:hypothetical protein
LAEETRARDGQEGRRGAVLISASFEERTLSCSGFFRADRRLLFDYQVQNIRLSVRTH